MLLCMNGLFFSLEIAAAAAAVTHYLHNILKVIKKNF